MDFGFFNLLGACVDVDLSVSRLHDVINSIDSSDCESLYGDLVSLSDFIDSICSKYFKK